MNRIGLFVAVFTILSLVMPGLALASGSDESAESATDRLVIWSQWASEPAAVEAIEYAVEGYEEASGVDVELEFFDRGQLEETFRTVMAAGGSDAPDIVTFSRWQSVVEPGWVVALDDVIDPELFVDGSVQYWEAGVSERGIYRFPLYVAIDYILYNPQIFDEVGVEVPDDYTFTANEWVEVIERVSDAGYAGVANAIGDRPYPGQYIFHTHALSKLGPDRYHALLRDGTVDWSEPDVREVLEYVVRLREAGMFHDSFLSMGLEEYHTYFHTQHEAATIYIGSWYVNRAFQPRESGGQSPDFRFGMLRYPEFPDGDGNGMILQPAASGGFGIVSTSDRKDVARDFFRHWQSNPSYGAVYAALTNQVSALEFSSEDMPSEFSGRGEEWQWYHEQMSEVYGGMPNVLRALGQSASGEYNNAMQNVLNEGLPADLITVDEAIETLNEARMTVPKD
jgi:ABC-type glycerol-3-phosphate transport system substrate-binding protein